MLHSIFSLYAAVTLCKKFGKFQALICYDNQKAHFGAIIVQNARFFPKNHLSQFYGFKLLQLHAKNQKSSMHLFFTKVEKPCFGQRGPNLDN